MKVRYRCAPLGHPNNVRIVELAEYLQPRDTGSTQGQIEQLESELNVYKEVVGKLLSWLVESGNMPIEQAESICGIHESYREYRFPDRVVIE